MKSVQHCITAGLLSITSFATASSYNLNTGSEVGLAAMILGLDAESLACVDVQSNEIPTVLTRLETELPEYAQFLVQQELAASAQQEALRCQATLRSTPSDPEMLDQLQNAEAAFASAVSTAQELRQELIRTVLNELADSDMLDEVFFTPVLSVLPAPYRLAVDTSEAIHELSWALKTEARADQSSTGIPSEATAELSAARTQYDVNLGITRVQQYEASNQLAIENWIQSH